MTIRRQCFIVGLFLATLGCSRPVLETSYASYSGKSINGVRVFVELLRAQGHKVTVRPFLSGDLLAGHHLVIIFASTYDAIDEKLRARIDSLLEEGDAVACMIVLRDVDSEYPYWEAASKLVRESASADELYRVRNRMAEAMRTLDRRTDESIDVDDAAWYGLDAQVMPRYRKKTKVVEPAAIWPFPDRVVADGAEVWFRRRLIAPPTGAVVWKMEDDPLVVKSPGDFGDHYIVANATFLTNAGLVHAENRRLAARLPELVGDHLSIGVVLSSFVEGEDVYWRVFRAGPVPWIVGHLLVGLAAYAWYRWPIFGRPRTSQNRELKRFGRHVEALGDLLQTTGQLDAAIERIERWRKRPRGK